MSDHQEKELPLPQVQNGAYQKSSDSPNSEDCVAKANWNATVDSSRTNSNEVNDPEPTQNEKSPGEVDFFSISFVKRILYSSGHYGAASRSSTRPWRTSLIRFGPLSGIFSMVLAMSCIIASMGILAGSNQQPTVNWTVTPSTYLAIFTALANLSMRYAAIQGVVIAWWVGATKGSTLGKLHWDWRSGTTLRGALSAGRHTGLLGLACIFSTIVVIDGPLLQRSTSVKLVEISNQPHTLDVRMVPELPKYYTGGWAWSREVGGTRPDIYFNLTYPTPHGRALNNVYPDANFDFITSVANDWAATAPIRGVIHGCPGNCTAKLRAPALAPISCSNRIFPVNYSTPLTPFEAPPLYYEAFMIVPTLNVDGPHEIVELITGFATITDTSYCAGSLNMTMCAYQSAIGEYDIQIENNEITIQNPGSPKIVALANNTQVDPVFHNGTKAHHFGTLAGPVSLMIEEWQGHYLCYADPIPQCWAAAAGAFERYVKPGLGACPSWRDPGPDVHASFNQLLVYAGAAAARKDSSYLGPRLDAGVAVNTSTIAYRHGMHNVFETDWMFFIAAAIVELVCICLVAPTYWGWWKIGRPCSFSPLEMAKAFESPMLAECNSNSSGRDLARSVGEVQVKYGAIAAKSPMVGKKLAFANPNIASRPEKGVHFM